MIARIRYTWDLMKASMHVLRQDKQILIFPLLSGISCILVLASFVVSLAMTGTWAPPAEGETMVQKVAYYGILFLFYFCNYFVITFFNVALVACAVSRLTGGSPTFMGGIREAFDRIHLIAGWALLSATVGLILRIIEDQSERLGAIIAAILGSAWTVLTYLVVPILVVENKGPLDAFKESTRLLKKTWGEQIVGNFSFSIIFFLLGIPGIAIIAFGLYAGGVMHNLPLALVGIGAGVVYFILLSLIQSALQSIFQAAVYLYCQDPQLLYDPQTQSYGFPVQLVGGAMAEKA